jgi:hypothetical protein
MDQRGDDMNERIAGEAQSTSRVVERPAWSPAQIFGVADGVVLVVIGAIALARTGTHFSSIPATHAMAVGLHFTCLSAIVQLGAGVLLLGACVFPMSAKSAMATFGVLLVAWGIVIVADITRLFTMWGYTKGTRNILHRDRCCTGSRRCTLSDFLFEPTRSESRITCGR